jgi:LysM repeat protein
MNTRIGTLLIGGTIAVLICTGCIETYSPSKKTSAPSPPPPSVSAPSKPYLLETPKEEEKFIYHKIMAGETMGSIAKWYSGDAEDWVKIAEANPGVKPTALHIGDKLKIPASMATEHKEQPDFSTASLISRSKKDAQAASETTLPPVPGGVLPTDSSQVSGTPVGAAPAESGGSPAPSTTAPPQPSTAEPCFGPR